MKEETKKIFLYSITLLISINLFLLVINYGMKGAYIQVLWACYIGMALISIGIARRKYNLVLSQILILAIPDSLWIIDLIFRLITGKFLTGFATNMFLGMKPLEEILFMQHLYTVPLAILALYLMKPPKKKTPALIIAFAEIIILFVLGLTLNVFIPQNSSLNCLPTGTSCSLGLSFTGLPYYLFWFAMVISMVVLSYLVFTNLKFLKKKT